jgi:class 3 adenylate cyclase/tetratricopeptide (TPR) repeat protein
MVRKTVTVLFADVTGSTALGEQLDPEALRRVMTEYFGAARATLERHGGTVEKFIGDAVMAVFGIPAAHEDDALRALRAAAELRDADLGVTLRIGVNTGQVVTGEADTLVTGDAVNVAARLEQAAAPGEVLVGDSTYRLAQNAVRAEEAEPIDAKGKSEPVRAWRLIEVLDDAPAFTRKLDAPFVGRNEELAQLVAAFELAAAGTAQRVTVVGAGGIGKSRLARELVQQVGSRARVVVGRCLPYGEGITYWPISEIVRQTAGDRDSIRALVDDDTGDLVADRVAAVVGLGGQEGGKEETQWAVRRLLESLASDAPLIAVFDDLHWAEPTFLDLVEYLSDFASAPLLVLCTARPDLLDARPAWTMPRPNTLTVVLERLGDDESNVLIEQWLDDAAISEVERRHVVEAAEGNPLFVEQLLALRAESDGGADWRIPPTIQALLAARIDGLGGAERSVVERASVEGRFFHRGAVVELAPDDVRAEVGAHLGSLVRKEFIRPDHAQIRGDDGYRFAHILVRDAAYDAMAKELRAELHERFVDWLLRVAPAQAHEWDEILGYHLERAARYQGEIGLPDDRGIARRAAELLGTSGERARDRGDLPAARNLLERATALLPPHDPLRVRLLPTLAFALLLLGEIEAARDVSLNAQVEAEAVGDAGAAASAWAVHATVLVSTSADADLDAMERRARELILAAEESGDLRALVMLRIAEGDVWLMRAQFEKVVEVAERLLPEARAAGDRSAAFHAIFWIAGGPWLGPMTVSAGHALVARARTLAEGPLEEAGVLHAEAAMYAMEGKFDEARRLGRLAHGTYFELGIPVIAAGTSLLRGFVELAAGDLAAAEREFRSGCDDLRALGETGFLSTTVGYLGHVLYLLGRVADAEEAARECEAISHPVDAVSQGLWRSVRARVLAQRGSFEEAERLAREAIAWFETTDSLEQNGLAYESLAEVLELAGRRDESIEALDHALGLYERKEHQPYIRRLRSALAELRA